MADIAFPTLGVPYADSVEMALRSNNLVHTSPLNGSSNVIGMPGSRWIMTLGFDHCSVADAALLSAWLVSLQGMVNVALLHNFHRPTLRGTLAGTPLVKGAGQTGTSLLIDGVTNGTTLLRGDYIGFNQGTTNAQLVMITADATAASGEITASFFPEIRTSPADNSAIVISSPVGRFRLATPEAKWTPQVAGLMSFSLDFVETFG